MPIEKRLFGPTELALHAAVKDYLALHPGVDGVRKLADECSVSMPTIIRWAESRNLATPAAATAVTKHIRTLLDKKE